MSSWHPHDLVSDRDLEDYESTILTTFGQSTWAAKRTKALEDWLFPILRASGFTPHQLRTRFDASQVLGYTGAAYVPLSGDIALASVFVTPSSDALFVGSDQPFRGIFLKILDAVSAVSATLTVHYWAGAWSALDVIDGTVATAGKPFSQGGGLSWELPTDWSPRSLNGSAELYWARMKTSAVPTGAVATQMGTIRASVLRAPVVFRVLELIMREAPTTMDGPWKEKADYYADEAARALERALPICGGEFDTDTSGQVDATENAQTAAEAGGGWRLERG